MKRKIDILEHLGERISSGELNFFAPYNATLTASIHLASTLSFLVGQGGESEDHHSFFSNSSCEALYSAIKLARHYGYKNIDGFEGQVVFLDTANRFHMEFGDVKSRGLLPKIQYITNMERFRAFGKQKGPTVLIWSIEDAITMDRDYLRGITQRMDIVHVLELSSLGKDLFQRVAEILSWFQIYVWGEHLTNHLMPFGAITAKKSIYSIWNNVENCGLHSNTYGGNAMVSSFVNKLLASEFPHIVPIRSGKFLADLKKSKKLRAKCIHNYLNLFGIVPNKVLTNDSIFTKSRGLYLERVKDGRPILDCLGSSGCNGIGHNNEKFWEKVKSSHLSPSDIIDQLRQKIYVRTGLKRTIQGISGASVVEIALRFALLSQDGKEDILILKGNYSGKTMVSMAVSDIPKEFFKPFYNKVHVLDINSTSFEKQLMEHLKSKSVALIWMECIQGRNFQKVGEHTLELIFRERENYGYHIGFDEILNGGFRVGNLTSFSQRFKPDIITFSKVFSGMILPNALLAISDEVYQNCLRKDAEYTMYFSNKHQNRLRAAIALQCLHWVEENRIEQRIRYNQKLFLDFFKTNPKPIPYIKNLNVEGLHINVEVDIKRFPLGHLKPSTRNLVFSSLLFKKKRVMSIHGRFLPSFDVCENDLLYLAQSIKRIYSIHPMNLLWYVLVNAIKMFWIYLRIRILNLKELRFKTYE